MSSFHNTLSTSLKDNPPTHTPTMEEAYQKFSSLTGGSILRQVLNWKREERRGFPGEKKMNTEMKQYRICGKQLDVERA